MATRKATFDSGRVGHCARSREGESKRTKGTNAMDPPRDLPLEQNGDAPNPPSSTASAEQQSASEFINDLSYSASASGKKQMTFCNETIEKGSGGNAVICESQTLTQLVSGATWGTCGKSKISVVEVENKRNGLASLLELKCTSVACPPEVLSAAYKPHRATAAGREMRDPKQSSGSAHDTFAFNMKVVSVTTSWLDFVASSVSPNRSIKKRSTTSRKKSTLLPPKPSLTTLQKQGEQLRLKRVRATSP